MPVQVITAESPLIIALPLAGSDIPTLAQGRLSAEAQALTDGGTYLDHLLAGRDLNATTVKANFHHYLSNVDAPDTGGERNAADNMIGVIPLLSLSGEEIWHNPPNRATANSWKSLFHAPFHAALGTQVARVRARNGHAVVLTLKHQPAGKNNDDAGIEICANLTDPATTRLASDMSHIVSASGQIGTTLHGKYRCGWITRRFSQPELFLYSFQVSISQSLYLTKEPEPGLLDSERAEPLKRILGQITEFLVEFRP